jgi:hypothetical protein
MTDKVIYSRIEQDEGPGPSKCKKNLLLNIT